MPKSRLSQNFEKFLWPVALLILGGLFVPLILSRLQNKSSDIVVRQFYNTIEPEKVVPTQIGGLLLDYQPANKVAPQSLYLIEVSNEGKGPEEDLRLQASFPSTVGVSYHEEPDFRVYRPEEISLDQNRFFMSLKQFPQGAKAPVAFQFGSNVQDLCGVRIKAAGQEKEGRVEGIRGVLCGRCPLFQFL